MNPVRAVCHFAVRRNPMPNESRQPVTQVLPLRVKVGGDAVLPVWVAWKPKLAVPPGAREEL